jgi:hypothetical protein
LIGLAAAAVAGAVLMVALLALIGSIECDSDQLDTVDCDDERADAWGGVRLLLAAAIGLGLIAAVVLSVTRARWWPLGAYVAFSVFAIPAWFGIGGIEVEDRPVPKLSQARLLADSCGVDEPPLCSDGIPATFTVSEPAEVGVTVGPREFEDGLDFRFESSIVGEEQDDEARVWPFDAGTHEIRVSTELFQIVNDLGEEESVGPLRRGVYELTITMAPQGGGNQGDGSSSPELVFAAR